jgi:hypothetical protein
VDTGANFDAATEVPTIVDSGDSEVIPIPKESSEDEAASDHVSTIVIGEEAPKDLEDSTDNEVSKMADSIELSGSLEPKASDTTDTTEIPETPELAIASLSTLTLEQATEQISPEILKTLVEQFNGSLESIRPVNRDDHLF